MRQLFSFPCQVCSQNILLDTLYMRIKSSKKSCLRLAHDMVGVIVVKSNRVACLYADKSWSHSNRKLAERARD